MSTHQIQHEVQHDGRIVLEDLPVRRGQTIRITLETDQDPFAVSPPVSDADLAANQRRLRSAVVFVNLDPEEPLLEPSGWDSFTG